MFARSPLRRPARSLTDFFTEHVVVPSEEKPTNTSDSSMTFHRAFNVIMPTTPQQVSKDVPKPINSPLMKEEEEFEKTILRLEPFCKNEEQKQSLRDWAQHRKLARLRKQDRQSQLENLQPHQALISLDFKAKLPLGVGATTTAFEFFQQMPQFKDPQDDSFKLKKSCTVLGFVIEFREEGVILIFFRGFDKASLLTSLP